MTIQRLSNDCLMTAWRLPDNLKNNNGYHSTTKMDFRGQNGFSGLLKKQRQFWYVWPSTTMKGVQGSIGQKLFWSRTQIWKYLHILHFHKNFSLYNSRRNFTISHHEWKLPKVFGALQYIGPFNSSNLLFKFEKFEIFPSNSLWLMENS